MLLSCAFVGAECSNWARFAVPETALGVEAFRAGRRVCQDVEIRINCQSRAFVASFADFAVSSSRRICLVSALGADQVDLHANVGAVLAESAMEALVLGLAVLLGAVVADWAGELILPLCAGRAVVTFLAALGA